MTSIKNNIREELIELVNSTNFNDPEQAYLYAIRIKEKMRDFTGFIHTIQHTNLIFSRARKHRRNNSVYLNTSDLWYPRIVKKCGRGNYINKPVFYCSNYPGTSMFEINPEVHEWITTMNVKIKKKKIDLLYFGINPLKTPDFENIPEVDKGIHEFMNIIFKEKVNSGEEYNYLKTAVIINFFLNSYDGVAYPSVGSNCKGWNVVFSTNFIDKNSVFQNARVHQVVEKNVNDGFKTKCLFKSDSLTQNGDFIWMKIQKCPTHTIDEEIYH